MDKYECLTGEDLGLRPSTTEQARFDYPPLSKIFNAVLDKDDKKEGLFTTHLDQNLMIKMIKNKLII